MFPEDPRSNKAVAAKMLLDQLLWAPVFSCVFFTFIHLLQARLSLDRKARMTAELELAPEHVLLLSGRGGACSVLNF